MMNNTVIKVNLFLLSLLVFFACSRESSEGGPRAEQGGGKATERVDENSTKPIGYISRGQKVDYRAAAVSGGHTLYMYTADW